ncbi:hypothetical protein [Curtobacterium aetherium]|uniref:Uncharacterized protein n=1 Tax=Curtobacterium aetherium TaxID=2841594 RepID=A0ACD1E5P2_9MICO|nr:hypothetical protein [Curtobacterium sp. L6-1]QWS34164.1 hypothetical protein KM842_02945 [Curtobacterium sp. L6-1]
MHLDVVSTGAELDPAAAVRLRRAAEAGSLVRVARGAFTDRQAWDAADARERHRALIRAVMPRDRQGLVLSHASAVAVHGLPWIGSFGDRVVVTDPGRDRGQVKASIQRVGGRGRSLATVSIDGLRVTSLAATAVDVAIREHPWRAIAVLDAALRRGVTRTELGAELEGRRMRNPRVVRALVRSTDGDAESVGESITRWGAVVLGAPPLALQHEFRHEDGTVDRVDLWQPDLGVVIEFDGLVKYSDPAMQRGRAPHEIVVEEKRREDRLRRHRDVTGVGRATWREAMPGGLLPRILLDAGLPLGDRWPAAWRAAAIRAL